MFLFLFIGASALVVFEDDLIMSLIFLAMASLFLIILIYLYRAPDVALTFSIVSTAASTVLFLAAIKKLEMMGYKRRSE